MADNAEFAAGLAADLKRVHRQGIAEDVESVTLPRLAELARLTSDESDDGSTGYCCCQIRALLCRAIDRIETTEKRRRGVEALLDLTGDHNPKMYMRRATAASFFGYVDGDSFRHGKVHGRQIELVILEEVQAVLLDLARVRRPAMPVSHLRSPQPRKRPSGPSRLNPPTPPRRPPDEPGYERGLPGLDGTSISTEPFSLHVDRQKRLTRLINEGHYDRVDAMIPRLRFKAYAPGGRATGWLLRCVSPSPPQASAASTVRREMLGRGLRPATFEELLAFGAQNPEEQREAPVVALAGSGQAKDGSASYVPYLWGSKSLRCLQMRLDREEWPPECRFLAISSLADSE